MSGRCLRPTRAVGRRGSKRGQVDQEVHNPGRVIALMRASLAMSCSSVGVALGLLNLFQRSLCFCLAFEHPDR